MQAFLRDDLQPYCRDAPPGILSHDIYSTGNCPSVYFCLSSETDKWQSNADYFLEFNEHQRSVFCVFSGTGVIGLRAHLNSENSLSTPASDDDDQTMTGMTPGGALDLVPGAFPFLPDDDDADGDEDLDDNDAGGISFDNRNS